MFRLSLALSALALTALLSASPAGAATAPIDPALSQTVTADETIAAPGTPVVISAGHVDLGPLMEPGLDLLARDDTAHPPVWRHLDDVVLHVPDTAAQELPAGEEFAFTGASPGEQVWVVPQTEVPGVPWLGWNTQSPALTQAADRGVTYEFAGHRGPGQFSLFLQNGGFEPPQQLWNSSAEGTQPFWVELNTHTHANWVFTEPGIHQVAVTVTVPLLDATSPTITRVLTFAVGEDIDLDQAQATEWEGEFRQVDGVVEGDVAKQATASFWWVLAAGILLCVALAIAGFTLRRRGER
ncbi:MAG: choice-of-anchor M domain-containing protein [Corynebacterium sp.]|uniref:choice-of-anchor M domain-containing protein n=1 Tax=Corynebacterium sp. TaxID=1720 RepID=UPI0026E0E5E1|nr:choice-of-anchor M domain-containing protein [Corynebacterium sp.]MDO5671056.1 choice-of-anchor M domain-containing protein [Corynebacterium sp.]